MVKNSQRFCLNNLKDWLIAKHPKKIVKNLENSNDDLEECAEVSAEKKNRSDV